MWKGASDLSLPAIIESLFFKKVNVVFVEKR